MANNILVTNFNYFEYQILYSLAKFAPYEFRKNSIFKNLDKILSIYEKSCKVVY